MRERVCKNCGGRKYVSVGQNMLKCEFCGTLYVDDAATREEEILLARVNEAMREANFDDALAEIEKLLSVFPNSSEAHFLKALAKAKIVLYSGANSQKEPRFFGEACKISGDEDFLHACELASPERAEEFENYAQKIDQMSQILATQTEKFDCFVCVVGQSERSEEAVKLLLEKGISVFEFSQEKSEDAVFSALSCCKVLLLLVKDEKKLPEFSNVVDRWKFFVSEHKKPASSIIMALGDGMKLPPYCQNVISLESSTFFQDVQVRVANEIERFPSAVAKIESVKIERVNPEKKVHANVSPVKATPVGRFIVENVTPDAEAKKKWAFLCLKNGDFQTAESVCEEGLKNDPNSSDLLFARLLASRKVRTRDDFFSDISNFENREEIERILNVSSREYAESFVDDWEKLVEKLDDVETFLQNLTYLAKFETPEREHFISCAQNLAIETGDENLISAVETCFDGKDVDRFVNFYFALAQRHDEQKWLSKVLELDEWHFESNLISLLSNFKTAEEKLTFRSQEIVENALSHMDEVGQANAISSIVNLILDVAFLDLKRAQEQLDFYLSYLPEAEISKMSEKIANFFLQKRFFTVAEKYASIAASKDKNNEKLYWLLVKIKMHCQSDNELVTSCAKIMTLPEWQTLLSISDAEYYSQIAAKANMYSSTKIAPKVELLDKVTMLEKLNEFLLRNKKILLEAESENVIGTGYFQKQLAPIEAAEEELVKAENFESYEEICDKIFKRLSLLDLNLNMSINISTMQNRAGALKVLSDSDDAEKLKLEKKLSKEKTSQDRKKFLTRFVLIFFEYIPLSFTFLLCLLACTAPKSVFMFFSQEFLLGCAAYSLCIVLINFVLRIFRKRKKVKRLNNTILLFLGLCNFVLFLVAVVFCPTTIQISSASELQTLMKNARQLNFELSTDIDFGGKTWSSGSFSGTLIGNGNTISNVVLSGSFFTQNSGKIENLTLEVTCNGGNFSTFGALVGVNYGTISNCTISGEIAVNATTFGGFVGENYGLVELCCVSADMQVKATTFGGLIGKNSSDSDVSKNLVSGNFAVEAEDEANVGGVIGLAQKCNGSFSQNAFKGEISCTAEGEANVGGLIGQAFVSINNSYAQATISVSTEGGYVGGLVGSAKLGTAVSSSSKCYAVCQISATNCGALAGYLLGRFEDSFWVGSLTNAVFEVAFTTSGTLNCSCLENAFYDSSFNFSSSVWQISDDSYPKFLFEN